MAYPGFSSTSSTWISRTTESSKRVRMGRLFPKKASAMLASFSRASSSAMQMGSSCTLPEVITKSGTGVPGAQAAAASSGCAASQASAKSCISRCCTGV